MTQQAPTALTGLGLDRTNLPSSEMLPVLPSLNIAETNDVRFWRSNKIQPMTATKRKADFVNNGRLNHIQMGFALLWSYFNHRTGSPRISGPVWPKPSARSFEA